MVVAVEMAQMTLLYGFHVIVRSAYRALLSSSNCSSSCVFMPPRIPHFPLTRPTFYEHQRAQDREKHCHYFNSSSVLTNGFPPFQCDPLHGGCPLAAGKPGELGADNVIRLSRCPYAKSILSMAPRLIHRNWKCLSASTRSTSKPQAQSLSEI